MKHEWNLESLESLEATADAMWWIYLGLLIIGVATLFASPPVGAALLAIDGFLFTITSLQEFVWSDNYEAAALACQNLAMDPSTQSIHQSLSWGHWM